MTNLLLISRKRTNLISFSCAHLTDLVGSGLHTRRKPQKKVLQKESGYLSMKRQLVLEHLTEQESKMIKQQMGQMQLLLQQIDRMVMCQMNNECAFCKIYFIVLFS